MLGDIFNQGLGAFYIISQVFALISFVFDLVAVQRRKKASILNMDTMAAFASFLHYAFLGAWAGMVNKIITTIRNALAAWMASTKRKPPKIMPLIFVVAYVIIGAFTFNSVWSVLPIIASSYYSVVIYMGDARKIRYAYVITNIIWLVYNAFVFSIVGVIAQVILIINGLVAIWRYRKKGRVKK